MEIIATCWRGYGDSTAKLLPTHRNISSLKSGSSMEPLSTTQLAKACRIFMDLAYPEGPASMPPLRRCYYELRGDEPLESLLPPSPAAAGIVQLVKDEDAAPRGYAFRLGSAGFRNLKLRAQTVDHGGEKTWVFMVDTHDSFSKESRVPPPDHPDAAQWLALQQANQILKEQIEHAWAEQGVPTFNALLRDDLKSKPGAGHE